MARHSPDERPESRARQLAVQLPVDGVILDGDLHIPGAATGLVLFAHGSGSSRHSPRNRGVARYFNDRSLATLLIDLLTTEEGRVDDVTRELRFDIPLLARRVAGAALWCRGQEAIRDLPLGLFGASTGAAAALVAAGELAEGIAAVVSRGGRPDLAGRALPRVTAPTLLLVGGEDRQVLGLNELALAQLACPAQLVTVDGATHLFEEPGTLEEVARLAADWFVRHFAPHAGDKGESPGAGHRGR
jgi:pimeloyl-ACP methyl ester carboxylesterase